MPNAYENMRPKNMRITELLRKKTRIQILVCFNPQIPIVLLKDLLRSKLFLLKTKPREDNFRIYPSPLQGRGFVFRF